MPDKSPYRIRTTAAYHCVARCQQCEFREDDYLIANDRAKQHVLDEGHEVALEKGYLLQRELVSDLPRLVTAKT